MADAVFQVLAESGVAVHSDEAFDAFSSAGADISARL